MPEYQTANGFGYTVRGVECDECPVSFITGETKADIDEWSTARKMKEIAGVQAGPDLSSWAARDVDVWRILAAEENKFESARADAER
jgi:hypothetical protein